MNINHFRIYVLRPTLEQLKLWSPSAEMLLLGTALAESDNLCYLHQLGKGPALGLYQMEPRTHDDIWDNFLSFRKGLRRDVLGLMAPIPEAHQQLMTNLAYATAMARVHYLRKQEPLPAPEDLRELAHYWKTHYNTHLGKGNANTFVRYLREAV